MNKSPTAYVGINTSDVPKLYYSLLKYSYVTNLNSNICKEFEFEYLIFVSPLFKTYIKVKSQT